MASATTESMAHTDTNRRRSQDAYQALERLLQLCLVRGFSGTVALELDVRQGTIINVESLRRERH